MDNQDTAQKILHWCDRQKPDACCTDPFDWPTDGCGYAQHIKFVKHRNENWKQGNMRDWVKFVRKYAEEIQHNNGGE